LDQGNRVVHRITRTLIVLWAVGALALFLFLPGVRSLRDIAMVRLFVVTMALVIVVGAAALGSRLFRFLVGDASHWERLVFGSGLGLGGLSLLVFVLGHISTALLPLLFLGCGISIFLFRKEIYPLPALPADALSRFVLALVVVFFLLGLTMCFLPPIDYDALEYHLGAPAEYLRAGRIHFLPHNVYSSFPSNMEMLYLFSLSVGDLPFTGAAVAKTINLLVITLAAASIYCLGRELVGEGAGLMAAAAFYLHPLTTFVTADPYVEGGLVLYTVLALHGAASYVSTRSPGRAAVAGIAAGLAAGCKYTAAVFVAVPVVLFVALVARNRKGLAAAVVAACCFAAAFLPWAARNAINTRNPVYPLAHRVFGGAEWSAEQDARFAKAHRPPEAPARDASLFDGLHELGRRLFNFLAHRTSGSPFLLIFVPLALVLARERRTVLALGFFLWCFSIWFLVTHRVDRFMMPALPALCLLGGIGANRAGSGSVVMRFAAAVTLAISAVLTAATEHVRLGSLPVAFGLMSEEKWLQTISERSTYSTQAADYINGLPEDSRVLLVGDAQIYYLQRPVVYSVVFNDGAIGTLLAGEPESARARIREAGITHVFVNWWETQRLRETYAYTYEGKRRPGYLPDTGLADIFAIVEGLPLDESWGPDLQWSFLSSKHRIWELYGLRSDSE
jgi:4-amino-4-deoxy-L-arabinose transferase-like glycosyltransferase